MLLIGTGVGWLMGLSVSPVVTAVVTSLLGIVAGIVTSLKTIKENTADATPLNLRHVGVDARPAALLVIGIALAVPGGIVTRTHHLLEPAAPAQNGSTPTKQAPATTENDLQRALVNFFDRTLQSLDRSSEDRYGGYLFNAPVEQCDRLLALAERGEHQAFVGELKNSILPYSKEFAARITDLKTLQTIVEILCRR
jgi:hypothetical protein